MSDRRLSRRSVLAASVVASLSACTAVGTLPAPKAKNAPRPLPAPSTVAPPDAARWTDDAVDHLGVVWDTRGSDANNAAFGVADAVAKLGIRHIRAATDGVYPSVPTDELRAQARLWTALAERGIHTTVTMNSPGAFKGWLSLLAVGAVPVPPAVESINEWQGFAEGAYYYSPFKGVWTAGQAYATGDGVADPAAGGHGFRCLIAHVAREGDLDTGGNEYFQSQLWCPAGLWDSLALSADLRAARTSGQLPANVQLLGPSCDTSSAAALGFTRSWDFDNFHQYPGAQLPEGAAQQGARAVVTEFGFSEQQVPDETANAQQQLRFWWAAYLSGVRRSYLYEIFDDTGWGPYRTDGTDKVVATAYRRATGWLRDGGRRPLVSAVKVTSSRGTPTPLANSDGSQWLVLWDSDQPSGSTDPSWTTTLSVTGRAPSRWETYDPLASDTPVATQLGGATYSWPVKRHPTFVRVIPAG